MKLRPLWQLLAVGGAALVLGQITQRVQDNPWITFAISTVTVVSTMLAYRWVVRRTERRAVAELAAKGAAAGTALGTLIGAGLSALVIANIAFLGFYEVEGLGAWTPVVGLMGFMAAASVTEELVFRGILFRIVEEKTGTWIALVLTGTLFGLMHLPNEDATLWGAIAIAIEAGGMLTAAYIATRNLWLPIGLHFGWNFACSAVFSTVVSGNGATQGLLDATTSGPMLVTGGDFGPEGSLYSIAFCAVTTMVLLWVAHRRGHLVPRPRRIDRTGGTGGTGRAETTADLPQ